MCSDKTSFLVPKIIQDDSSGVDFVAAGFGVEFV
jgi:hypothetical protein